MALVRSLWRHNFPILQSLMGGRLEASAPPFPCMALSGISSGPDSSNEASTSSGLGWLKGPVSKQKAALEDNEWIAESQSSASGSQTIWRSVITGEATAPGVPKPQTWHQVVDKKSGLIYYWCPGELASSYWLTVDSNETQKALFIQRQTKRPSWGKRGLELTAERPSTRKRDRGHWKAQRARGTIRICHLLLSTTTR